MEPSWTRWFLTGFLSALAPPVVVAATGFQAEYGALRAAPAVGVL